MFGGPSFMYFDTRSIQICTLSDWHEANQPESRQPRVRINLNPPNSTLQASWYPYNPVSGKPQARFVSTEGSSLGLAPLPAWPRSNEWHDPLSRDSRYLAHHRHLLCVTPSPILLQQGTARCRPLLRDHALSTSGSPIVSPVFTMP